MRAGNMDRRIALESFALTSDGDPQSGTWSVEAVVWAEKMEKAQAERFVSEREIAEASRAYRIRHRDDVDPTWRLKDGAEVWDIVGTPEGEGRNEETILMVERHDPDEG